MAPDAPTTPTLSSGGWHSIRPWTPPLSLAVREITSVSVTFILSSNLSYSDLHLHMIEASLAASLGLVSSSPSSSSSSSSSSVAAHKLEDATAHIHANANGEGTSTRTSAEVEKPEPDPKKRSIISDALAKGLSVNVNGSPWQRVFIRIDEAADEAVIIIYGLMPGRQYDVDLALVHCDSSNNKIRQQITTEEVELELSEEHTDPESHDAGEHSSVVGITSDAPASTPSTSPTRTVPSTPPTSTIPLTIEDRLAQLQHTLALIATERDTLTASLKSARRDAQKADAALRSEIDILKRASEKHAAAEHRARQKVLSLQEAVKRAQAATREMEGMVGEVEALVPGLEAERERREVEYGKVKEGAEKVRRECERRTERERKRLEGMRGELVAVTNKMEKLGGKREKLETGAIRELEEQLREVESEIGEAERETKALVAGDEDEHTATFSYLPVQRMRHQTSSSHSNSPGTIGRPSPPAPIQRPSHNELWSPPPRQQQQTHTLRPPSLHTPILLTNPHRQPSFKSTTTPPSSSTSSTVTSSSSSSTPSTTSTLSSRAPAFEPGRPMKTNTNVNVPTGTSSGFSVSPTPIQRPAGAASRGLGFGAKGKVPWAGLRSPYEDAKG